MKHRSPHYLSLPLLRPFRVVALSLLAGLVLALWPAPAGIAAEADTAALFDNVVSGANLAPAAYAEWVGGELHPLTGGEGRQATGPTDALWTVDKPQQDWKGVVFGAGTQPGVRHLRIGFKNPVTIGSVLVRGGGVLSVLKANATYPGDPAANSQWLAAERLKNGVPGQAEVGENEVALWVLPPGTRTRALRFSHTPAPVDKEFSGHLGGAFVLATRLTDLGPTAQPVVSTNPQVAGRLLDGQYDVFSAWDNWDEKTPPAPVATTPAWVMLVWPEPVTLSGLNLLNAGAGKVRVTAYTGPKTRHPRESTAATDWREIKAFDGIESQYPRMLGVNWLDFGGPVTTRALRLELRGTVPEGHPHLKGNTKDGRRVWLGEVQALQALGTARLTAAARPTAAALPPVPIRFTLKAPGYVTLVVETPDGHRVRNLISETHFEAGEQTVGWDGMDDLERDKDAASHGLYHVPGRLVEPGQYRVRGLVHPAIDLFWEFPVYNPGNPPWNTADSSGNWLANHTPPQAACFVPAARAPGGKALVYLGSYVSEGTAGLAWVDVDGRKQGGVTWVGGNWTGAPFLAHDRGPLADAATTIFAGSAWRTEKKGGEAELRLTAIGPEKNRPVLKQTYPFAEEGEQAKVENEIGGLAAWNNLLAVSQTRLGKILFVNAADGKIRGEAAIANPRGLWFDAEGRLLVVTGQQIVRGTVQPDGAAPFAGGALISTGLDAPDQIAADRAGNLYVSDRGSCHQVKVFSPQGALLRTIGKPGVPAAGPYDPERMNNPAGLCVDGTDQLWVTEQDYQPKRVSVWTLGGKFVKAFYGPPEYGGGGRLDPSDATRFFYNGMEFRLNWKKGSYDLLRVFYRSGAERVKLPFRAGTPELPLYREGQRYFANCFNSSPTNGHSTALLFVDRDGEARLCAAMGRAHDWELLKTAEFLPRWPAGVDPKGDPWRNPAFFAWSDANGDGVPQPAEVTMEKGASGGVTVMPDLAFVVSRLDGQALRFPAAAFTGDSIPLYDLAKHDVLATGVQDPTSSGGDQALTEPDGWTVITLGVKPYHPYSLSGVFKGEPRWSYPSLWPGLHASHSSQIPDRPGMLVGTTRLLGEFFTPRKGDAGPLWCVNGNHGNLYLFTADGLFVATLFQDMRLGKSWSMPVGQRGMRLNDITLHDENFWPSLTQTKDGRVFLVDGGRSSLIRVEGLDAIRRLPDRNLTLTADDVARCREWAVEAEAARQQESGRETARVPLRPTPPTVDGNLDDWSGTEWLPIDKRGTKAYFNSDSKPYDVTAALAVAGDRLCAAWRTGNPNLLANAGTTPNLLFKTGGALDLMLGTDPNADPLRTQPAPGDLRLLVTRVDGKVRAVLYRPVVPGTPAADRVAFASPVSTVWFDRVEDVSGEVILGSDKDGDYELSVPLRLLGLDPKPGLRLGADLGILRGDGFQTQARVYWANKATGITADIPSEAMLTPRLWGEIQLE